MSRDRGDWRPILRGELAERARHAVDEIAAALAGVPGRLDSLPDGDPLSPLARPTLGGGSPGPALFFAYLHLAGSDAAAGDHAVEYLETGIAQIGALPLPPLLYEGFLGVAWAAQHLEGRLFEAEEGDDPIEDIDETLRLVLAPPGFAGDYDLIRGLVGLGVYALERLPRPAAREGLGRVLDQLEERAEEEPPGLAWWTPEELALPVAGSERRAHYNLGVAHGVPGIVGLLAEIAAAGVERERAMALAEGAVAWMLDQELAEPEKSFFPSAVLPGDGPHPARTAWCYGDPGIAAVLMRAARAAGRRDWERKARALARAALARTAENAMVVDAGLCHGAAGLGHIANRFYQATGDERFAAEAVRWLELTLDLSRPGQGVAGYSVWREGSWHPDPGFLTGASGVGLALLAATSAVEPAWDRLLLTSIPPAPKGDVTP